MSEILFSKEVGVDPYTIQFIQNGIKQMRESCSQKVNVFVLMSRDENGRYKIKISAKMLSKNISVQTSEENYIDAFKKAQLKIAGQF